MLQRFQLLILNKKTQMVNKSYILGITAIITCTLLIANYHHSTSPQTDPFDEWKKAYGISIKQEDEAYRRRIFQQNLADIELHNAKKGITYKLGINAFAHLTKDEFKSMYLEKQVNLEVKPGIEKIEVEDDDWIDWEARGAVTSVKTQGSCSSSYAFAAVGAVEGANQILTNRLYEYSNQQVVDCSRNDGNGGCNGGSIYNTFNYIQKSGLTYRSSYPYHAVEGTCMYPPSQVRISGFTPISDCTALVNALHNCPVAVMVDGSNMQFYRNGIFTNCGTTLSYNMLLTGSVGGSFDTYFTLKSSWGTSWGEFGYIRIPRGNACGVCMQAGYPKEGWNE